MLEQYRALGAMAALREFTVADLARYSDVNTETIRTVLRRSSHLIEKDGKEATGRRGGSYVRYRLLPGAEEELVGALEEVERVGAIRESGHAEQAQEELPTELLAAEHTVLSEFPATDDPGRRRRLLELARTSLADMTTNAEAGASRGRDVDAHCRILDFVIRLSEQELAAQDGLEATPPLTELFEEFVGLSFSTKLTDERILEQVRRRLIESPLSPSRSPKIDKVVMVSDTAQPNDADTRRVKRTLERTIPRERIQSASLTALPQLINEFLSVQTLYVLLINAGARSNWSGALREFQAANRRGDELVVFSDEFEPALANEVHELRGDYVTIEGLSRDGIVGAISQHVSWLA